MASSQEARDRTLLASIEGPLSAGVDGADRAALGVDVVGVTGLLKRLRRAGLFFGVGVKRTERPGLRPTLFSKLITLALTLVFGSVPPVSSELDESCKACWMSPVETAADMRRGGCKDLIGVPLLLPLLLALLNLLPTGVILFAELIVGRMADRDDNGREIDPKEGDFETPEPTVRRFEWLKLVEPEALDFGRLSSLSESFA